MNWVFVNSESFVNTAVLWSEAPEIKSDNMGRDQRADPWCRLHDLNSKNNVSGQKCKQR